MLTVTQLGMYVFSYTYIPTSYLYVTVGLGICNGDIFTFEKFRRLFRDMKSKYSNPV